MLLWNWLIPDLFSGPILTFWQSIGLLVLFKILFGHHGGGRHKCRKCCSQSFSNRCDDQKGKEDCSNDESWKRDMKSKWRNMSWNEKKEMKQQLKSKFKEWVAEDLNQKNAVKVH